VCVQLVLPGIVVPTYQVRRYRPARGTGRRITGVPVQLRLPFGDGPGVVWHTAVMDNGGRGSAAAVLVVAGVVLLVLAVLFWTVLPGPGLVFVGPGLLLVAIGVMVRLVGRRDDPVSRRP
jgi:hypothetical protein